MEQGNPKTPSISQLVSSYSLSFIVLRSWWLQAMIDLAQYFNTLGYLTCQPYWWETIKLSSDKQFLRIPKNINGVYNL